MIGVTGLDPYLDTRGAKVADQNSNYTQESINGAGGVTVSGTLMRREIRTGSKDGRAWEAYTLHVLAGAEVVRVDAFAPPAAVKAYELGEVVDLPVTLGVRDGFLRVSLVN